MKAKLASSWAAALICLLAAAARLPAPWFQESVSAQTAQPAPFQAAAGRYQLTVAERLSGLSLGQAEFVITVQELATGRPVPGARVAVWLQSPRATGHTQSLALGGPDTPGQYSARLNLDSPGIWRVAVEVSSPLGLEMVDVPPVEVPATRRFSSGSWVFIGVTLALVAGSLFVYWSARRARVRASSAVAPGSGQ